MKFIGIIPARYGSSRFPGKPLAMLGGKTVIEHVYRQVSSVLEDVYVATDDPRIHDAVQAFGGKGVMTRSDHKSGTDRICEALDKIGGSFDVVINEAMLAMLIGEDKERALKEYSRVLKPGGVLLTHDVVFREEDPKVQHELMAGLSKAINVHVEPLTLAGWKETIEKHAFRT